MQNWGTTTPIIFFITWLVGDELKKLVLQNQGSVGWLVHVKDTVKLTVWLENKSVRTYLILIFGVNKNSESMYFL